MRIRSLAVAAALLCATGAQADVVYNWQQISPSATIAASFGTLTLADFAASGGPYNLERSTFGGPSPSGPSPITNLSFTLVNPFGSNYTIGFSGSSAGLQIFPGSPGSSLSIQGLQVDQSGLVGQIRYGNTDPEAISLLSDQATGRWTVAAFDTDGIRPCYGRLDGKTAADFARYNCSGATGVWVLASAGTGTVPVPGTAPLVALASIAAMGIFRRKNREAN